MPKNLKLIAAKIFESFRDDKSEVQHFDNSPLPDKTEVEKIIKEMFSLLFPGYFWNSGLSFETLELQMSNKVASVFECLTNQVCSEIKHSCKLDWRSCKNCKDYAESIVVSFLEKILEIRQALELDVKAAFKNDPAASCFDEIIFSYPGLEAVAIYRMANVLSQRGLVLLPRMMTEWAHFKTGIDIHPGARIGKSFFIDHGTGVVIGETTIIGDNVTIYQGVTIGALNFPRDSSGNIIRGAKRHPTIEDDVVIYAGATILGGNTIIGKGSVIGGNVWLTESVPPNSRVLIAKPELKITPKRLETLA
ncbi:MAG: serine acetyltransferase [Candidatus Riflebacteria bacterium]|nr:serine acetyltransferase [Candidatus Riflebacteria bacterium]